MVLSVILMLMLMIGGVGIIEAEALTIRYRVVIRVKNKKKKKKVSISDSKITLYKKQSTWVELYNAKGSKVKWSVSKKGLVKLKKDGNAVKVTCKKKGTCYLRARYKGKTYKCKIVCKGRYKDAVKLYKFDRNVKFTNISLNPLSVTIMYDWPGSVSYEVEDPSIISCKWGEWEYEYCDLYITALRPGKTRIKITNSYNKKEVDYINVTVDWNNITPLDNAYINMSEGDEEDIIKICSDYGGNVYFEVENPNIAVAEMTAPEKNSSPVHCLLHVYPVSKGDTRIKITNEYNKKEVDYVDVHVY